MVALVTPFKKGKLDEAAFTKLIHWHIESGTSAIVPCGTTGESATLNYEEHYRVIELAVQTVRNHPKGKLVKILAGTGSNSTDEAIQLTEHAKKVGADGSLQVVPYYNKPPQEGILRHFIAIAKAVPLPMILYNIPGRTGIDMLPETVAKLSKVENIIGIKEASGKVERIAELKKVCGEKFAVLSGEDPINLEILEAGAVGTISVTANIVPDKMAAFCRAFDQGDTATAKRLHEALLLLHRIMFCEVNPIPVKTALALMGKIAEEFRLPLCPISPANRERLQSALKTARLI